MGTKEGQWWDKSITLVEGCTPVSTGCAHCWSAGMAHRFHQNKGLTTNGHFNGKIICREDRFSEIVRRKKPTRWVIWNDLFHPKVPFRFIDNIALTMSLNDHHTYQILTKRPERALACHERWLRSSNANNLFRDNVWLGVTIEKPEYSYRASHLGEISAAVRFISMEPLLASMEGYPGMYDDIDWVILGGESGPGARPCKLEWVRSVVNQCKNANVPVFVKQLRMTGCRKCGFGPCTHLHGHRPKEFLVKDINLFPKDLQIREYPNVSR